MKAVLDAAVSLRVALTSTLTPKAVKFLDGYRNQVHELIAPSIYPGEIANGLTKAERQKLIQQGQAPGLVAGLLSYPPILHDYEPLMIRATAMSSHFRAGFYDCLYVSLGEREGIEVVTADQKLINSLQKHFTFIRDLATL